MIFITALFLLNSHEWNITLAPSHLSLSLCLSLALWSLHLAHSSSTCLHQFRAMQMNYWWTYLYKGAKQMGEVSKRECKKRCFYSHKKKREIVTSWTWISLSFPFSNRNYSTLILRIVSKKNFFLDSVTICVTALEPHVWWISAPSVVDSARALAQTRRLCVALVARFQHRWLWTAPALTFQSTHSGQLLQSLQFSAPNKTHPELDDLKLAPNHLKWLQWLQAVCCKYNKANVHFCKMAHKWLASERLGNLEAL